MTKKISREKATLIFNRLSWFILENKFKYYCGAKYGIEPIADEVYDKYEDRYKKLAQMLKLKPTASDMVGFDENRPSCRLVMEKLIGKKR